MEDVFDAIPENHHKHWAEIGLFYSDLYSDSHFRGFVEASNMVHQLPLGPV